RRWVRPGLAATIVLGLLAVLLRTGDVEIDLGTRVVSRLSADGYDWARVVVSGRNIELTGTAPTPELRDEAAIAAEGVDGVASVVNKAGLLPVASPYVWSAHRSPQLIELSGYVPSEASRNAVLAAARRALPDAEIRDDTELARGAVPGFTVATGFALERLAELSDGLVTITDGTLSVAGVAATPESYDFARIALNDAVPGGITLGPVDLLAARADPFVWSASLGEKSITLAGFVPNEVVKSNLIAAAESVMPGLPVVDNMNIGSGEPEGFEDAAAFAIEALSRLEDGGVMLDGLTLDVAGTARSVEDYDAVVGGIGGTLPPGLEIVANAITPAPVEDYRWIGSREGGTVTLSGYVPSLENRAEVQALKEDLFDGLSVTDDVGIASGEPKIDWVGAVKFGMGQLAQLRSGSVTLDGKTYAIAGEAMDSDAFLTLTTANARTLPASLQLGGSDIDPPRASPYRLSVSRSVDGLVLAGYAPSREDKQEIINAARDWFESDVIKDEITFAGGAPDGFVAAATGAMEPISRLAGGRLDIADTVVGIKGTTFHQRAAERIAELASEAIPETFKADIAIVTRQVGQPLDADACRGRLEAVRGGGRVEFDKGASEIASDSFSHLDRIAGVLMRCPTAAIEVGGHSDSDGSDENNLQLTQSRADAVVEYLVDAGVRLERLTAVGYGEAKPIADNETEAGKAANRRIDFTIAAPNAG
ncbi:MAG: BON domain-containing protein, partial [Hyphomicrobiales bacterium]|nr:BON domain-containing protein [Hyphomicrobiales bacterium]